MAALSNYTLRFTAADVNLLAAALSELPLKVAGKLFGELQQQVLAQERLAAEPAAHDAEHHPV